MSVLHKVYEMETHNKQFYKKYEIGVKKNEKSVQEIY